MKDKNVKIYDKTGKLIVDLEAGLFDACHLTYEDWSKILMTDFEQLSFRNKDGHYIGGFIKGGK